MGSAGAHSRGRDDEPPRNTRFAIAGRRPGFDGTDSIGCDVCPRHCEPDALETCGIVPHDGRASRATGTPGCENPTTERNHMHTEACISSAAGAFRPPARPVAVPAAVGRAMLTTILPRLPSNPVRGGKKKKTLC